MHLLIIEDDTETAAYIRNALHANNHIAKLAADGLSGLKAAQTADYDALVVDRMLPGLDGLSIVKKLRDEGNGTPVLFLTALADVDDRVTGLQNGGDDYLAKPFAFTELMARLEAIVRRRSVPTTKTLIRVGDLEMNRLERTVNRAGQNISLRPREFQLLEYLMMHAGQTVTRAMLLEQVWGYHFDPQTSIIDVHVSQLRVKIDRHTNDPLIHTVRGSGYSLYASLS